MSYSLDPFMKKDSELIIEVTFAFCIMEPKYKIAGSMFITRFSIDDTIKCINPTPIFVFRYSSCFILFWFNANRNLISGR